MYAKTSYCDKFITMCMSVITLSGKHTYHLAWRVIYIEWFRNVRRLNVRQLWEFHLACGSSDLFGQNYCILLTWASLFRGKKCVMIIETYYYNLNIPVLNHAYMSIIYFMHFAFIFCALNDHYHNLSLFSLYYDLDNVNYECKYFASFSLPLSNLVMCEIRDTYNNMIF